MLVQTSTFLRHRLALANLRREQGVVAIEALLSIMVLVALTLVTIAVSLVIFNQAILNGASQMAAHEAVLVYDRGSYRDTYSPSAGQDAFDTATAIVNEDAGGGLLTGKPSAQPNQLTSADFTLDCAADIGQPFALCESTSGRFERGTVTLTSTSVYYWLTSVVSVWSSISGSTAQHATGIAFSSGPADH